MCCYAWKSLLSQSSNQWEEDDMCFINYRATSTKPFLIIYINIFLPFMKLSLFFFHITRPFPWISEFLETWPWKWKPTCSESYLFWINIEYETVADLRGGARDAPLAQNFFIFMQFSGKIGQIIGWRPPLWAWRPLLWEILDPPLWNVGFIY